MRWSAKRGDDGLVHVFDEEGVMLFRTCLPPPGVPNETMNDYARLAARAPELLAALRGDEEEGHG